MGLTKRNVPKVRFPGFTDDWGQRKVGDVITEVSRPIEMEDNKQYQLVTVKRRNEGVVSRGFFYGRDILVKNYYEIHAGDYLISKRQIVHGANGLVPEKLDKSIVSNEYMVCEGNGILTAEFLTLLSKTKKMKRDFFLSSYGVDIEKLFFDVSDWKKRSLVIPSIPEQNLICAFFKSLDNLITLHQRELANLETQKKAVMGKIFSQEVRFKRADGSEFPEWEEKPLGEVCEPLQYGMNSAAGNYDGKNKYIRITDIDDSTHAYLKDNVVSPMGELSDKYLVRKGDILLARTGASTGKSYLYN